MGFEKGKQNGCLEPSIVTLGSSMSFVSAFMGKESDAYTAEDVMKYFGGIK